MITLNQAEKETLSRLKDTKNPTYLIYIQSNQRDLDAPFVKPLMFSNQTFLLGVGNEYFSSDTTYFSKVPIKIGNLKDLINYETKAISPNTLQVTIDNVYYPEGLNDNVRFTQEDINKLSGSSKKYLSDYIFRNENDLNLLEDFDDDNPLPEYRTPESLIGHTIEIFVSSGDNVNATAETPIALFKGYIDKAIVSDIDIKINCKDASYKLYDANFPIEGESLDVDSGKYIFQNNYLDSNDSIPEKYRNNPLPATYGIVDAAPTSIISLKRFDEFLSIAYNNYDSAYYSDIDIVSDNRSHFYLDSTFDMGSSYLHDRGYLQISGTGMYACVKQYNTEILDEPLGGVLESTTGGVFGEALAPAEGREQYTKKNGYENKNNYFSIISNNPIIALDFLEVSFFNYPSTVTPFARSKETSEEAETSVMQPTHDEFIIEIGNQLYLEGNDVTEIDMSPLYDGNAFSKIEYATIDIDGGAGYIDQYSPSNIGANTKQTISGFKVKFKPTGIGTNYHLGFPLYKIGLNRHIELHNDGNGENWWNNFVTSEANDIFRKRASQITNPVNGLNRTVGIKTDITDSSSQGARGIEFMPLIEQLDLYDGLIPGTNTQQAGNEAYGGQYACLVPNSQIQPNNQNFPRWLAARDTDYNQNGVTEQYNKKHFVFDNYHSWNWLNLNKRFGEAYGYNLLNSFNVGNRLRADMGAGSYGSPSDDGGSTKNFILSQGQTPAYDTTNSWDWTVGADDFTEFFLGCDMMINDVHKFELYNFMIFHIGVVKGIDNQDYFVNTFGRETTNVVTDNTRPIYRLFVCPTAETTCQFVNPKLYTNQEGNHDSSLGGDYGPYFYNGIPNSWQLPFEPHTCSLFGNRLPPISTETNDDFFGVNQSYYHNAFAQEGFVDSVNWIQRPLDLFEDKIRYSTSYHRLMNRAKYENIVGSVVEDELGNRMKILKVHYDKYLYNRRRIISYYPTFDIIPREYTSFDDSAIEDDSQWITITDDFSFHRNLAFLPDIILVDVEMIEGTPHFSEGMTHPENVNDELENYFKEDLHLPDFNQWKQMIDDTKMDENGNSHVNPQYSIRVNKDGFGNDDYTNDNYENRVFRYQHSIKLSDGILTKPSDIVNDILFEEYKLDNFGDDASSVELSVKGTNVSREFHTKQGSDINEWDLAFSVTDKTKISTLLTDINLNSKCFTTYSTSAGSIKYPTIKDFYTTDQEHYVVNPNYATKFKYSRTREENVKSSISLNYKKSYSSGELLKSTEKFTLHDFIPNFNSYEDQYKKYYGIEIDEDLSKNYISFNSDFIRDDVTAKEFCRYNLMERMNQKIIVEFEYQLFDELFTAESGDIIRFTSKPNHQNIYGIDITTVSTLNSQVLYPFFMILSIEKDTSKCNMKVKAIQLHSLIHKPGQVSSFANAFKPSIISSPDDYIPSLNLAPIEDDVIPDDNEDDVDIPIYGCTDPNANNYNPDATVDNNTCQYGETIIYGCMDQSANGIGPNNLGLPEDTGAYNPDATEDDGSCQFHNPNAGTGDVNFDGTVDILDIVGTVGFILNNVEFTEDQIETIDMDGNGSIDVLDLVALVTQIIG